MLKLIRFWLPVTIMLAGIVVVIVGGVSESALTTGIPIFSAGASIWLLNFLYRVGVEGDKERDEESLAREHFAEHGEWPVDKEAPRAPNENESTQR
jgi:hypothetical protein